MARTVVTKVVTFTIQIDDNSTGRLAPSSGLTPIEGVHKESNDVQGSSENGLGPDRDIATVEGGTP